MTNDKMDKAPQTAPASGIGSTGEAGGVAREVTKKEPMGKAAKELMAKGIIEENPVAHQVLGICACLAVTNKLESSLVMGIALIFVLAMSNVIVSILRSLIPRRIRMIVEVAIIATFVIIFDQFLKAYYWEMSKQLGPYVGLIITNCIVMGRAEAYASQNPPHLSLLDGLGNGLGFAAVLAIIGFFRELIGSGTINAFGLQLPSLTKIGYAENLLFVLAPGAFFVAGFLIWVVNWLKPQSSEA